MKHKIIVAIPCYNCEKQIVRVIGGFNKKLLDRVEKVIVINNRSTDNTVKAAKAAIKKLGMLSGKFEVYTNNDNYNLGGSHKVAFLYGEKHRATHVAILHGDDQAKTQELHRLIDALEQDPTIDAVLGTRFMRGSKLVGYAWQRVWGNRAINVAYSIVAMQPSRDLGSGLNIFGLSALKDHEYLGYGDTMTFNIDLLLGYFSKHAKLKFVPISWYETDQVSNARNFNIGKTALRKLLLWRIGKVDRINKKPSDYTSTKV